MRLTRIIFFSFVLILVAYRIYLVVNRPIPDNIQEKTKVRILDEIGRLANGVMDICMYVGLPILPYARPMVDIIFGFMIGGLGQNYPHVKVYDHMIGNTSVRVFLPLTNRKRNSGRYPTMVYFHGGGWTWFSVVSYTDYLSNLANKTKLMIVAPDYEKEEFPSSYQNCERVTWYVLAGKSGLPVDKQHVIVGGDGSGGNLAAAVAQHFRQKILMQVLINPALQLLNLHTPSYREHTDILSGITSPRREIIHWLTYTSLPLSHLHAFMQNSHVMPELRRRSKYAKYVDASIYVPSYMNVTKIKDPPVENYMFNVADGLENVLINTSLAPLMLDNLRGVPNAYIVTSQYDVLRDDGIMYAARLDEAQVKVKLNHYPNAFHGFFLFSCKGPFQFQISRDAADEFTDFVRYHLRDVL